MSEKPFTVVLTMRPGVQIRLDGVTALDCNEALNNDLIKFEIRSSVPERRTRFSYVRLSDVAAVHCEDEEAKKRAWASDAEE